MGNQLQTSVGSINDLNASTIGDTNTPVGAIVRILNNQLLALTQIDNRVTDLAGELERMNMNGNSSRNL